MLMTDTPRPVIELRHVSFGYADRAVVRSIDLDVRPGEVVALLGPNGSGKSTLVRGLLGLTDQLGGEATVLGQPLRDLSERYRIGYVPQRHTLSGSVRATVEEVVAVGRLPHQGWFVRRTPQDRRAITEALELVGLAERAGDDVSTLSGGQQRRVLIARALAAEPDLLIMDEPTAGVDEASQRVLAEVLRRLTASGRTLLIVTHEVAALRDVVTRIVELTAGRVSFDGTPERYAEHRREQIVGSHPCPPTDPPHESHLPSAGPLSTGADHA